MGVQVLILRWKKRRQCLPYSFSSIHCTHNKFPLRISSVKVTKSAGICRFRHIYWRNPYWKTSFFVQWSFLNFDTVDNQFQLNFIWKMLENSVVSNYEEFYESIILYKTWWIHDGVPKESKYWVLLWIFIFSFSDWVPKFQIKSPYSVCKTGKYGTEKVCFREIFTQ